MTTQIEIPRSKLTPHQVKTYGPKSYTDRGKRFTITAEVRYDDECHNGHNTFAITADIRERGREYMGGCCHDEVAKHFPELAPFIKWHLMNSDGPMYYLANTLYHAGNRDHNGLLKGEFRQMKDCKSGLPLWEPSFPEGMTNVWRNTLASAEKPPSVTIEYKPYGRTGEGKERQLDFARSSAVWPEATDEQLCAEPEELKKALVERLPGLIAEFKLAVESLGFVF